MAMTRRRRSDVPRVLGALAPGEHVGTDFEAAITQPVTSIGVPLFGPGKRVAAMLSANPFPNQLSVDRILMLVEHLLATSAEVSARLQR